MALNNEIHQDVLNVRENLKKLLSEKTITVKELSKKTRVPQAILLELEKGTIPDRFHLGHLIRLCGYFGIEPIDIFFVL